MGPEISFDYAEPTDLSEIWSLGQILFELLCGSEYHPFRMRISQYRTKAELTEELEEKGPNFPADILLSSLAKDLITRILKVDPAKRLTIDDIIRHPFLTGKVEAALAYTKVVRNHNFSEGPIKFMTDDKETLKIQTLRLFAQEKINQDNHYVGFIVHSIGNYDWYC